MTPPMRISVLIPTFRRAAFLAKALGGLAAQGRPADQIVVGTRPDDHETTVLLDGWRTRLPILVVTTETPGVVASMSAAAGATDGDIVCLLDDDAEPLPDWISRIERRFAENPRMLVLGGRDLLRDHPEMRANEPTTGRVGLITPYGRILGNHHRGSGPYRPVQAVKGCNAAARGEFLRRNGFEDRLRGTGAQVHWEIALCLDAINAGGTVAYDPEIRVIHHIAPRHDSDLEHRGIFSSAGLYNMVWNEHFVIGTRARPVPRAAHLAWSLACGSLSAPGLMQYVRLILKNAPNRRERLATTLRAIRDARSAVAAARATP